jgi:hypothetical protein
MIEKLYEMLVEYKFGVAMGLVPVVLFWDRLVAALKKAKDAVVSTAKSTIGKTTGKPNMASVEDSDQAAIRHLRNRAAESKDEELIKLIKEIDTKFYDIHSMVK